MSTGTWYGTQRGEGIGVFGRYSHHSVTVGDWFQDSTPAQIPKVPYIKCSSRYIKWCKSGVVIRFCNPSTREADVRGSLQLRSYRQAWTM
jgi:hypothetical protein